MATMAQRIALLEKELASTRRERDVALKNSVLLVGTLNQVVVSQATLAAESEPAITSSLAQQELASSLLENQELKASIEALSRENRSLQGQMEEMAGERRRAREAEAAKQPEQELGASCTQEEPAVHPVPAAYKPSRLILDDVLGDSDSEGDLCVAAKPLVGGPEPVNCELPRATSTAEPTQPMPAKDGTPTINDLLGVQWDRCESIKVEAPAAIVRNVGGYTAQPAEAATPPTPSTPSTRSAKANPTRARAATTSSAASTSTATSAAHAKRRSGPDPAPALDFDGVFHKVGVMYLPEITEEGVLRTVRIDNIPGDVQACEILQELRGGKVYDFKLVDTATITGSSTATVSFVLGASAHACVDHHLEVPLVLGNRQVAAVLTLERTPTYPIESTALQAMLKKGHSRCLKINNWPAALSMEHLKRDATENTERGLARLAEVIMDGKAAFMYFTSIDAAKSAQAVLKSTVPYKGLDIQFIRDPCCFAVPGPNPHPPSVKTTIKSAPKAAPASTPVDIIKATPALKVNTESTNPLIGSKGKAIGTNSATVLIDVIASPELPPATSTEASPSSPHPAQQQSCTAAVTAAQSTETSIPDSTSPSSTASADPTSPSSSAIDTETDIAKPQSGTAVAPQSTEPTEPDSPSSTPEFSEQSGCTTPLSSENSIPDEDEDDANMDPYTALLQEYIASQHRAALERDSSSPDSTSSDSTSPDSTSPDRSDALVQSCTTAEPTEPESLFSPAPTRAEQPEPATLSSDSEPSVITSQDRLACTESTSTPATTGDSHSPATSPKAKIAKQKTIDVLFKALAARQSKTLVKSESQSSITPEKPDASSPSTDSTATAESAPSSTLPTSAKQPDCADIKDSPRPISAEATSSTPIEVKAPTKPKGLGASRWATDATPAQKSSATPKSSAKTELKTPPEPKAIDDTPTLKAPATTSKSPEKPSESPATSPPSKVQDKKFELVTSSSETGNEISLPTPTKGLGASRWADENTTAPKVPAIPSTIKVQDKKSEPAPSITSSPKTGNEIPLPAKSIRIKGLGASRWADEDSTAPKVLATPPPTKVQDKKSEPIASSLKTGNETPLPAKSIKGLGTSRWATDETPSPQSSVKSSLQSLASTPQSSASTPQSSITSPESPTTTPNSPATSTPSKPKTKKSNPAPLSTLASSKAIEAPRPATPSKGLGASRWTTEETPTPKAAAKPSQGLKASRWADVEEFTPKSSTAPPKALTPSFNASATPTALTTSPEVPVTSSEVLTTTRLPEQSVTTPIEAPTTIPEEPTTALEISIQPSKVLVRLPKALVRLPQVPIILPEEPITPLEAPIISYEPPVTIPSEDPISSSEEPISFSEELISSSEEPITSPEEPILSFEEPITSPEESITSYEPPITTPSEEQITSSEEPAALSPSKVEERKSDSAPSLLSTTSSYNTGNEIPLPATPSKGLSASRWADEDKSQSKSASPTPKVSVNPPSKVPATFSSSKVEEKKSDPAPSTTLSSDTGDETPLPAKSIKGLGASRWADEDITTPKLPATTIPEAPATPAPKSPAKPILQAPVTSPKAPTPLSTTIKVEEKSDTTPSVTTSSDIAKEIPLPATPTKGLGNSRWADEDLTSPKAPVTPTRKSPAKPILKAPTAPPKVPTPPSSPSRLEEENSDPAPPVAASSDLAKEIPLPATPTKGLGNSRWADEDEPESKLPATPTSEATITTSHKASTPPSSPIKVEEEKLDPALSITASSDTDKDATPTTPSEGPQASGPPDEDEPELKLSATPRPDAPVTTSHKASTPPSSPIKVEEEKPDLAPSATTSSETGNEIPLPATPTKGLSTSRWADEDESKPEPPATPTPKSPAALPTSAPPLLFGKTEEERSDPAPSITAFSNTGIEATPTSPAPASSPSNVEEEKSDPASSKDSHSGTDKEIIPQTPTASPSSAKDKATAKIGSPKKYKGLSISNWLTKAKSAPNSPAKPSSGSPITPSPSKVEEQKSEPVPATPNEVIEVPPQPISTIKPSATKLSSADGADTPQPTHPSKAKGLGSSKWADEEEDAPRSPALPTTSKVTDKKSDPAPLPASVSNTVKEIPELAQPPTPPSTITETPKSASATTTPAKSSSSKAKNTTKPAAATSGLGSSRWATEETQSAKQSATVTSTKGKEISKPTQPATPPITVKKTAKPAQPVIVSDTVKETIKPAQPTKPSITVKETVKPAQPATPSSSSAKGKGKEIPKPTQPTTPSITVQETVKPAQPAAPFVLPKYIGRQAQPEIVLKGLNASRWATDDTDDSPSPTLCSSSANGENIPQPAPQPAQSTTPLSRNGRRNNRQRHANQAQPARPSQSALPCPPPRPAASASQIVRNPDEIDVSDLIDQFDDLRLRP